MTAPASRSAIAVFDLDGTITRGDTFAAFLLHMLGKDPLRLCACLRLPYQFAMLKLGRLSNDALKTSALTAVLKGKTRAALQTDTARFVQRCIRRSINPAAIARIDWHRTRNHRLVLASASIDLYVPSIATHLGFDETVCTRLAWAGGEGGGEVAGSRAELRCSSAAVAAGKVAVIGGLRGGCGPGRRAGRRVGRSLARGGAAIG